VVIYKHGFSIIAQMFLKQQYELILPRKASQSRGSQNSTLAPSSIPAPGVQVDTYLPYDTTLSSEWGASVLVGKQVHCQGVAEITTGTVKLSVKPCCHMDQLWGHYVKWNIPVAKRQVIPLAGPHRTVKVIGTESRMMATSDWGEDGSCSMREFQF
jgi:hypothetical protein